MGIVMLYRDDLAFEGRMRTVASADEKYWALTQNRLLTLRIQVLSGSSPWTRLRDRGGEPLGTDPANSRMHRLGFGESLSENRPDTRLEQSSVNALHQLEFNLLAPSEANSFALQSASEELGDNLAAPLSAPGKPENSCPPSVPDFAARVQASETSKLADITLDDMRIAQGADDCLQPIIKALEDCAQPPQ